MEKFLFLLILIASFLIPDSLCPAQTPNQQSPPSNSKIDSLLTIVKTDKADTNQVNHFNKLAIEYITAGLYNTARHYGYKALQGSVELNFNNGIINSYNTIGQVYFNLGDYPKALDYYFKAMKIAESNSNKTECALTFNNIGNVYFYKGSAAKAQDYYLKALKIYEGQGDKNGIALLLKNIGNVYYSPDSTQKALSYYLKSLKFAEETGNKNLIALNFGNIGTVYSNNIKDRDKALDYYFKALKIQEELGDKLRIATNLLNIGNIYLDQKKYKEAEKHILGALAIDTVIRNLNYTAYGHTLLCKLYTQTGNYKKALEHYQKEIIVRDSLNNLEKNKDITRKEMNFEFDKKEAITKAENDKQQAVAEAENKKQRFILMLVSGVLLLVFLFAGYIFRSLRITRGQKNTIELQKNEMSLQKEIVEKQKEIVDEKQKEIVDSINYAKRIQYTLLANDDVLMQNLNEHFVLFQPKDIVSGDFYWAAKTSSTKQLSDGKEEKTERFYLAVCDSTGHGVPGAFMSLLNISFLNEAIIEKNIEHPDEILNHVRRRLVESISKDGAQDGMDGILICFEKKNKEALTNSHGLSDNEPMTNNQFTITYAAANNTPIIVRDNAVLVFPADKMPIGKGEKDNLFALQTIDLEKGDTLYLYTDGYADQFGGPKGKKFMYKQLDNLLISINQKSMEEQKQLLASALDEWKGNIEQVDDVCIIGIRI